MILTRLSLRYYIFLQSCLLYLLLSQSVGRNALIVAARPISEPAARLSISPIPNRPVMLLSAPGLSEIDVLHDLSGFLFHGICIKHLF
jgi:hypothetical protein